MLQMQPDNRSDHKNRPCIGLALAGGGPLGIIYEIGTILALEEALEGVEFNNVDVYVGVSAGAVVTAGLANGFSPAKMCQVFIRTDSDGAPILDELGELKNVTLGGSPSATFDSGDGAPGKRPT